jgi:hypothetical protein
MFHSVQHDIVGHGDQRNTLKGIVMLTKGKHLIAVHCDRGLSLKRFIALARQYMLNRAITQTDLSDANDRLYL